jgi:FG-GAP-like repeat
MNNLTTVDSLWRIGILILLFYLIFGAAVPAPALSQSPVSVFNCSGFASSGPCGVTFIWGDQNNFWVDGTQSGSTPALQGTQVNLLPGNTTHAGLALNYQQAQVNVQSFSSTFTFVPNGWNIAFVLNNNTNNLYGGTGANFSGGAGCEAGFFQGFAQAAPPNNVFAIELDSWSWLTLASGQFTYSSAQIYTPAVQPSGNVPPGQSPCIPNLGGTDFTYVAVDKVSTSPVNLTTGTQNSTTLDTYSVTITYDGSNLTIRMYDVTAGGSCPGATCFTYTWTGIDIPTAVGGNTAWLGLTSGTNDPVPNPLLVNTWSFTSSYSGSSQYPLARTHDFNGDGKSDLAWRDGSRDLALWLMNAGTVSSSVGVGRIRSTWAIVGQHDFNGDGMADLLWRDTSGDVSMWFMNGTSVSSMASVGNMPTNWSVVGVADFNGDGIGDLLWGDSSGDLAVWVMNGATVMSSASLGNVPTNWTVVGVGDFNGDGMADILWRDNLGDTSIWFMNGTTLASTAGVGNIPTNWSVVGIGDFNGDGKSDIAWRDTSGDTFIWLMNGASVLTAGSLGNIPTTWSVAQTGDYNGDGMSDLLWQDNLGDTVMWFMNGTTVASSAAVGNTPTNWTVQSVNAE